MKGFDQLNFYFLTAFHKATQRYWDANKEEAGKALWNSLMNLPGPRRARTIPEKSDAVLFKLWEYFSEIEKSIESTRTIQKYIRYSPPKKLDIKLSVHLSYHVHNYLNEIYILQCRLESFSKVVLRTYKSDIDDPKSLELRIGKFLSSFKSIVTVRGHHVHRFRYESPEIDRLSEIELLLSFPGETISYALLPEARTAAKSKWLQTLADNERAISEIIDGYAKLLTPILFTRSGTWKCPTKV